MNMDKLTQIDDDVLDMVSGGGVIDVGGSIGLDPVGKFLAAIGDVLSSLPQFVWGFKFGFEKPQG
jgi:hypothetical protein